MLHLLKPKQKRLRAEAYIKSTLPALWLPLYRLAGGSFTSQDGHGHTCTVTGATWGFQGRTFDGSDDKIDAGNPVALRLGGAFTLIAWMKTSAAGTNGEQCLVGKWTSTGAQASYALILDNGKPKLMVTGNGSTEISVRGTVVKNNGLWHQIVGVFSPSNYLKVYADGVEQPVTSTGSPEAAIFAGSTANVTIGYFFNTTDNFFTGTIDEVQIYNRALSSEEITNIYQATEWRY